MYTEKTFEEVIRDLNSNLSVLRREKGEKYASELDRLHNFKTAAALNHETVPAVIWGMLVKHIVSLADMIRKEYRDSSDFYLSFEWEEKLFDAIIYLQILYAAITEDKEGKELMACSEKGEENV
jgi:dynactin complex subunit